MRGWLVAVALAALAGGGLWYLSIDSYTGYHWVEPGLFDACAANPEQTNGVETPTQGIPLNHSILQPLGGPVALRGVAWLGGQAAPLWELTPGDEETRVKVLVYGETRAEHLRADLEALAEHWAGPGTQTEENWAPEVSAPVTAAILATGRPAALLDEALQEAQPFYWSRAAFGPTGYPFKVGNWEFSVDLPSCSFSIDAASPTTGEPEDLTHVVVGRDDHVDLSHAKALTESDLRDLAREPLAALGIKASFKGLQPQPGLPPQ